MVADIAYGPLKEQKLDLRFPRSAGPWPLVVYIHGGAWTYGDKGEVEAVAAPLTAAGFAVASINYRLHPAHQFPAMLEDSRRAVRFLRSSAARFNIDADRVAAMGHSAGGHLAALLGTEVAEGVPLKAVIDMAGPADLLDPDNPQWMKEAAMKIFTPGSDQGGALRRAASPVFRVGSAAPAFLIVHGDADPIVPVSHSLKLRDALLARGVPAETLIVPGGDHLLLMPQIDTAAVCIAFLKKHLLPFSP